jgi:2-methylcitrate dehydratase PrpD
MTITDRPVAQQFLAEELGAFAANFRLDERVHAPLIERVRWHVLDSIGLAMSSWTAEDRFAHTMLRAQGADAEGGPCTIIGDSHRASPRVAAFMNGSLVHGSDFDDVDLLTVMHCEAFATASLLAIAERDGLSGRQLVEAWVVAAEVALRLASGANGSGGLFSAGFHNSAVFGTFGVAAGASRLLGLSADQTAQALALSASFASGTSVGWLHGSGRNKPPQAGWAAQSGMFAADMAAAGYSCSVRTLDAPRGVFDAHASKDGWSRAPILDGLGEEWRMLGLALKLYPCGAMIQATAECADVLRNEQGVQPDEIISGRVVIPEQFWQVVEDMGDSLYRPPTGFTSIGAFPCVAARILLDGHYGLEHQTDEMVRDERMLAIADRLEMAPDPDHDHMPLDERPATITLETTRGTFSHTVSIEAGQAQRLTEDKVIAKFRRNAELLVPASQARAIEAAVSRLDALGRVDELSPLLSPMV